MRDLKAETERAIKALRADADKEQAQFEALYKTHIDDARLRFDAQSEAMTQLVHRFKARPTSGHRIRSLSAW